jgi:hypothetical protein
MGGTSGGGAGGSGALGGQGSDFCAEGFVSNESCNGVDDDCDGQIDELGTFTCGVGACARTVAACSDGAVSACLPLAPSTSPDGCNGVDDDCDGAVDEDCTGCVPVSPTGNDAMALATNGATPFATVQAAIDFADAHRTIVPRVCVAAGSTCGETATFAGPTGADLTIRNGVSVLGNYESTAWTRCTTSTTRLAPQTGTGVLFPASVTSRTVLDGFVIDRFAATTTAGVSVVGARGVVLSNLRIIGSPMVTTAYGVDVTSGGDALIYRSVVNGGGIVSNGIAIRSVASRVDVLDNCPGTLDATTGRCTSGCGIGTTYGGTTAADATAMPPLTQRAIVLDASPGSRIERSGVCSDQNQLGAAAQASAMLVQGDASNVLIRGNTIRGDTDTRYFAPAASAVRFLACGGAAPWVVGNASITSKVRAMWPTPPQAVEGALYVVGDCAPVIEGNSAIEGDSGYPGPPTQFGGSSAAGIVCSADSTGPSLCVVTQNSITGNRTNQASSSANTFGTGVSCGGESCSRIDHNRITGVASTQTFLDSGAAYSGTGLGVGSSSVVSNNQITGTCVADGRRATGTGVRLVAANGLLVDNEIVGMCSLPTLWDIRPGAPTGLVAASTPDREWIVRSNVIRALPGRCGGSDCSLNTTTGPSIGISLTGTAGVFESNYVTPGSCSSGLAVSEGTTSGRHPRLFLNNHLLAYMRFPPGQGGGSLYRDAETGHLLTAAAVDALTDTMASGTTAETCPP